MTSTAPGRFIDIHVLQTIPYANLNRDETNSVKTVEYGGTRRTRVSSQSWKRATRTDFQDRIGEAAVRTRRIGEAVERFLRTDRDWPADLARRAGQHTAAGSSIKADPPSPDEPAWSTNAMVYVPETAIARLADLAEQHRAELESAHDMKKGAKSVLPKDDIDAVLRSTNGVINLFGRMLREVDSAGVDGAVQAAHAFTTHATDVELDYFAAVDDLTDVWNEDAGSAHMGDQEYSAGLFYRYATVDVGDLLTNIGGDLGAARTLVPAFLEAFLLSVPRAKKTATAPHTIPDLAHIAVRTDRPVSYAAAFEKPVISAREGGYTAPSCQALADYAATATRLLGTQGLRAGAWAGGDLPEPARLGQRCDSFPQLVAAATTAALGEGSRQ
ncbi:type I-E CRISPR-associated protein Cas7/Cse4/CasC [Streptomonospora wellingtoniae]|uniref:Type I-E CRISPR-associated protein Cas7/Cse4/CasC n=1 Tax=Streptomonospora wellingtoniae TaxID=3075544 RepID=A0ABU2KNW7_9ACTN|nr:type I-E CRISPR-associated protein Cas7/Cse4/CasC [Streptomonospora sp. DSM 45055]MDT0300833.1 type I-E CRISPR-associated protein Cas7/Cse4/CasC [Streptomonospora sp. DSM 45055]